MIKDFVSLDEVIKLLNDLVLLDPETMNNLVENRIVCNFEFADHPTVQVQDYEGSNQPCVGLLGILNGFFSIDDDGWGGITAVFDDKGKLIKFQHTSRIQK